MLETALNVVGRREKVTARVRCPLFRPAYTGDRSMSQFCRFRLLALCAFALSAGMFSGEVQAVPQADQAAKLSVCEQNGAEYFSLRIPPVQSEAAASHDVVIVLNTSATMNGSSHASQKQALEEVLSRLGASDRVQIVTADVDAKSLTQGFVAANSPEVAAAVKAFDATTSLGATDLPKAIETSVSLFDEADPAAARSVLFIGDGRSRANLPSAETLATLTETCVENQVSVSSLGLGADVDSSLLEAIAGRTGGCFLAAENVDSAQLGDALVAAVTGPVVHVSDVAVPEGVTLYPTVFPPLRTDRSTVLVGKADAGSLDALEVTATAANGSELAWTADVEVDAKNAFLVKLVQNAEANGGVSLPLSDSSSLQAMADQFQQSAMGVAAMAQAASEMGDAETAGALMDTAKTVVPNLKLSGPQGGEVVSLTPVKTTAPLAAEVTNAAVAGEPATLATETVGTANVASSGAVDVDTLDMSGTNDPMSMDYYEGTVLDAAQQQELQTAQVKTAVEVALADAAKLIRQDPVSAQLPLKVLLPQIRNNTTIDAATRQRLVANIEAKLREASAQEEIQDARLQVERRKQAVAQHRATIAEDLLRKEKKVDQLSERYRALINEKNYRVAEEDVGAALAVVSPDSVIATHAIGSAQSQGYWYDAMALRRLRQKGVIDTLYQVEKAYVPFPDEPPLVYPDATTWRLLSDRRKKQAEELKTITGASEAEKKIYAALRQPIELRDLTPDDEGKILLSEVLDAVRAECGIEIVLDTKEIDTAGEYDSNSTVTLVKNISLRSALNVMLREYGLKYVVKDEVLLITTKDAIESNPDEYLNLRVYPVADLVIPIMSGGMGGMMGGGMMGGMGGGMMGGMGGGMMGGMGGGMGGMGGGMGGMGGMGGGMYNYPSELLKNTPAGGYRSWNSYRMVDDLSVVPLTISKPTTKRTAVKALTEPKEGWDSYFSAINAKLDKMDTALEQAQMDGEKVAIESARSNLIDTRDAAVRETVRVLSDKNRDQAIALMQSAIRSRASQAWMYDAMSIQMELAKRPNTEIERALLSAVEFAETPNDMLVIALYLRSRGFNERALSVLENVSKVAPSMPEPYVAGLEIAEQLKNDHGVEWTTIGILSQVWPDALSDIWEQGYMASRAHLDALRNSDPVAAEKYEQDLNTAVARDCVFIVTWVGDADIDLYVQEPTGSVCSVLAPQTVGGGVLLGNQQVQMNRDAVEGSKSEVYVCPRGFAGDYRVVVEKVWGDIAANQVRCEGFVHYGTDHTRYIDQTLTLDEDGRLAVDFSLDQGSRTESLAEVKAMQAGELAVAERTAQRTQQQLARLSQQKSTLKDQLAQTDSTAERELAERKNAEGAALRAANLQNLSRYAAQSGYRPEITWVPEGASLYTNAVISADRRYVRVTPSPMFQQIKSVSTFNYSTGDSNSSSNSNSSNSGNSSFGNSGGSGYNSSGNSGGYNSSSY